MSAVRRSLHEAIDRLDEREAREALVLIRQLLQKQSVAFIASRLAGHQGITLPPSLGEPFPEADPLPATGASATTFLVAERR